MTPKTTVTPSINIIQDSSQSPSSAIINQYLSSFRASISGLSIKKDIYNDFIKKLKESYNIKEEIYKITKFNESFYIREENDAFVFVGYLDSKDTYTFDLFSSTFEINHYLYSISKDFIYISSDVEIIFNNVGLDTMGKLNISTSIFDSTSIENTNKLYYPYLDTDEMFTQFNKYNENILVLLGRPGVGKTKSITQYMKYLIENPTEHKDNELDDEFEDYNLVYVKNEEVLAKDEFWNFLKSNNTDVVILDDLDYFLANRSEVNTHGDLNKNKFLSNLLSFSDGIDSNNVKFIISTNKGIEDIDKALLRKGRMFDVLELRPLKRKEARNIWESYKELNDIDFNETEFNTDNDILQCDLGSYIEKIIKDNGIRDKEYLKEENISKLNSLSNKAKIGV